MPRIYVEFAGLSQIGKNCKTVSARIDNIQSDFQYTVRQLDWDVKFQADINQIANQIARKFDQYMQILSSYQEFIMEAYKEYQELDNIKFDENFLNISSIVEATTTISNSTSENSTNNQFFAWLQAILEWMDKTEYDDKAGITGKGISYIESLYKFLTGDMKGLTGAENLFDLGDKSIGLWTGFYDYLKQFYNKSGDIFSIKNQTKVEGLNVVGSVLGLISSIFGTVDTISNTENIGVAGIIGQVLPIGNDIVDIWDNINDLKNISSNSNGIYTPAKFYTTIVKGYLSAFSQGFTSYEKYIADGTWDLNDTIRTGTEFSVSGLYAMVESLTFGAISDETTGVTVEDISRAIENFADNIGDRAGNYILNNDSLYKVYQESNIVVRVVISFYAVLMS